VGILLKKFRERGLVHQTQQHFLVIDESKIEEYLACNRFDEERWKEQESISCLSETDEPDLKSDKDVPFSRDSLVVWSS
jgi:hypothetical protein